MTSLESAIAHCRTRDRYLLRRRLRTAERITDLSHRAQALAQVEQDIQSSAQKVVERTAALPRIEFPAELPVVEARADIEAAIAGHQVVIVAGETGSGKTTQLPKILLSMGYGAAGLIGHTQPRRLAARSVATRIAEELGQSIGNSVGYKVRFQDTSSDQGSVKLMTDGILLSELQKDRYLNDYEVIIIDEAHERSLNIDFLLGILHQLLPKRPDLKLIITSATIETERFSSHFNYGAKPAPIISVSGRTFPVETRYQPVAERDDQDVYQGIVDAASELCREGPGDILVFLSGERDIRDTADALTDAHRQGLIDGKRTLEVIPLYARLSASEQNKVFQPHGGRRIVLATNVAETSLTVPGIRYVIDPGMARLSRYSYRTKVQRLPIEPVSQASANQRQGRCGRTGPGICIRLYSEDDFLARPAYTDPEILRTNLASVILQMISLRLGDIRQFPFMQKPDERFINDGLSLLEELHAIGSRRASRLTLTETGQQLARLPLDPRMARMILAARQQAAVREVMIICAALSIQDPRERPSDAQQKSDELHKRFAHPQSDFMAYLNLWNYLQDKQKSLSSGQFRKLCKQEFIHYLRVREWQDVYTQLRQSVREMALPINDEPASVEQIHQALLTGLLSHLGSKEDSHEYSGARGRKFFVFPGSGLFNKSPKWIMAAELVETSKLYARVVGAIQPQWIEPAAAHLSRKSHSEPHYEKKRGAVVAFEQVTLYGLIIVAKRKVQFGPIDPKQAREIYIREALVPGETRQAFDFIQVNRALIEDIQGLEAKSRRRDILIDDEALAQCYMRELPDAIYDDRTLLSWYRKAQQKTANVLQFSREQLMLHEAADIEESRYPQFWLQGSLQLPLSYVFDPNAEDDGVSVEIPLGILNQVHDDGFDWLIPALREERVIALIKALPKRLRRNFVPAPDYARAALDAMQVGSAALTDSLSAQLRRMTGVTVEADEWNADELPAHLQMNFKVINNAGEVVAQSRDLKALQHRLQHAVKQTLVESAGDTIEVKGLTQWTVDALPVSLEKQQGRFSIRAFPALVDAKTSVAVELFDRADKAAQAHRQGVRRLVLLNVPSPLKYLRDNLPNKSKLAMYFNPWGKVDALIEDCVYAAIDYLLNDLEVRDEQGFNQALDKIRSELNDATLQIARQVEQCLVLSHQIQKGLKGKVPLNQVQSYADMQVHLNSLIFKGFVSSHGAGRLSDIERYLKALVQRQDKLAVDPNRDRLRMLSVEKLTNAWQARLNKVVAGDMVPVELAEFRWMLEEFRVSLFAQQLGTRYPVSEQRLKQALDAI